MNFEEVCNNLKRGIHIYILSTNLDDFFEDIECDINQVCVNILDRGVLTQYYNTDDKGFIAYFDNTIAYNNLRVDQFNKTWFTDKNKADEQLIKISNLIETIRYNMKHDLYALGVIINKVNNQKLTYGNIYSNIMKQE